MQQYTNEITPEIREYSSEPPYDEVFLASCDSKTREELEDFNKQVSRPLAYIFRFAVVGSINRNGGVIGNASAGSPTCGYKMARVGSMLGNGDEIILTPQSGSRLVFREGDTFPKGFLTMPGSKH